MPKMIPVTQKGTGGKADSTKYAVGSGHRPSTSGKNPIPSSAPASPQKIRG